MLHRDKMANFAANKSALKIQIMRKILIGISMAAALTLPEAANAGNGVKVDILGDHNALLRVDTRAGGYLLLPVEESNDDSTIDILTGGNTVRTMYVRLARGKVDYYVPFNLTPYKGEETVTLAVRTPGNLPVACSAANMNAGLRWDDFTVTDDFDTSNTERFRPAYHHTPSWGWMNDPNGMFYKDGTWHLCYQWNPYGSKWQNMTWGHSTSTDLIHWEHHGPVLEPDGLGSIFSGSAAIDRTGSAGFGKDAVLAMYTSAGQTQQQSLAWSVDNGKSYSKYQGNPVLTLPTEARDPNMFFDQERNLWVLTLAHPLEHEMLFFTSPDMREWSLTGSFGKGEGAQGGVWECPDLFPLTIDGEKKWVLLCNLNPGGPFGGSGTQYFIGNYDGATFTSDRDKTGNVPLKWMDYGKDNYATVSFSDTPDGRRTAIGWMSNWQYAADVPTKQFRSANTLPRDLSLFRDNTGEIRLASAPSPEVDNMPKSLVKSLRDAAVSGKGKNFAIPELCELSLDIVPGNARTVTLTLANTAGEKTVVTVNAVAHTVAMDRRESGITDFSADFPAVTVTPTFSNDKTLSLRLFIDRSSIELFGNGGRFVMTNLVFPNSPYDTLSISSEGGKARIKNLKIYTLKF